MKQGYLDASAPAQPDPDPDPDGLMASSSELGVIFSLDGVFFFLFACVFASVFIGWLGRRRFGSRAHVDFRESVHCGGCPGGCSSVRFGSITISPLFMSESLLLEAAESVTITS